MIANRRILTSMLAASLMAVASPTLAQDKPATPAEPAERVGLRGHSRDYRPPAEVDYRPSRFMSEGVMLHAEFFSPAGKRGQKLPVIVMAHGWGGTSAGLREDAEDLARAGFLVMTFDYRGWGESDGRVILWGPAPTQRAPEGRYTTGVQEIRGYIDPFEQSEDWFNAITFASADDMADPNRLGLRGMSLSGGLVVYVAANDPRVKAIVSQGPRIDSALGDGKPNPGQDGSHAAALAMAKGEAGYPAPGARVVGRLGGAPVSDKMSRWQPNAYAAQVKAPALFLLADKEELVDNATNGKRAYDRVKGPKKLVTLPGGHFTFYSQHRVEAAKLAADWFTANLK
jgi:dienelactone hydrolase